MKVTRRHIQVALGLLWLLDGALQLQPYMFSTGFADQTIAPAATGQPAAVAAPVHWAAHLIAGAPVLLNTGFALGQLLLGAGLLWARTARWALAASIAWALSVWLLGEGLGGLAGGHALVLTGAPGAVLLYALAAALAWPQRKPGQDGSPSRWRSDIPPPSWAVAVWVLMWTGGSVLQLLPGNGAVPALASAADTAPGPLASLDSTLASALGADNTAVTITVALAMAAVGLGALAPRPWRTTATCTGIVFALAFWVLGQGAGLLTSGQSTDPNTGPLLVLLGVCVLGARTATLSHPAPGPAAPPSSGDGARAEKDPHSIARVWDRPAL